MLAGAANPVPVSDNGSSLTVDDGGSSVSVDDNGGSLTVDGTVAISTGPAAARTTDSITSTLSADAMMSGLTVLTPKFQKITASASGATTIVAAVAGKKILVLKWDLVCNGAVNVKWQSHVTPTDLTGLYYFAANGGIASAFSPVGHFATVAGEALDINLSGAVAVGGVLTYVEV